MAGGLAGVLVSMLNNGQAGLSIAAGGLSVAAVILVGRRRNRVRQDDRPVQPTARAAGTR